MYFRSSHLILLFFLAGFLIFSRPSNAQAATLYFNNAGGDYEWSNLASWWQDAGFSIPATSLPTSSDDAILYQAIDTNVGPPASVNTLTVYGTGSSVDFYIAIPVTAANSATFNNYSNNRGTVIGDAVFNDHSENNAGLVTGSAIFYNSSDNFGTISGNATFNDTTFNAATVTGDATFNGSSVNGLLSYNIAGHVNGNAIFTGTSFNPSNSTVTGSATFSDSSYNDGTVSGDATFSGLSYNNGTVTGNANFTYAHAGVITIADGGKWGSGSAASIIGDDSQPIISWVFQGNSTNNGSFTGDATFYGSSLNNRAVTITGNSTFNDSSVNNATINGDVTFNGSSNNGKGFITGTVIFNGTSSNNATVHGDCTFNDSSFNGGVIVGTATFKYAHTEVITVANGGKWGSGSATSNVGDDGLPITSWIFNGSSSNEGTISGNATFNGSSANNTLINGNVTFNGSSNNNLQVNGSATFNDGSVNNGGTVTAGAIFNGTSINYGTVTGNTIFNISGSNLVGGTISGNAFFNGTTSNFGGIVTGDACFASTATNGGTVNGTTTNAAVCPTEFSTSFTSTQDGNWNDGAIWGHASPGIEGVDFPGFTDNATIANSVTINQAQSVHNTTVLPGGTLSLGANTFSVSGNFTNTGTLDASTSTVILTGTNQTILGANTFHNLTKTTNVADTLTFDAANTTTVAGTLTLTGISTGLLTVNNSPEAKIAFDTKFGASGTGGGEFNSPQSTAFDASGNMYIVDVSNKRVQKFDSSGNFILAFGWGVLDGLPQAETCTKDTLPCYSGIPGSGAGQFNFPGGIGVDSLGDVYVSDADNNFVQKFTSSGNFLSSFGWGVSGGSGFEVCTLADNITTPCRGGIDGSGDGQFSSSQGIAIDSSGDIYVVDARNGRVQKFKPNETFDSKFGTVGTGDGELSYPGSIAFDALGNIYVSEYDNNRVSKFGPAGNFLSTFGWGVRDGASAFQICTSGCHAGLPGYVGYSEGQFSYIMAMSNDALGNIYVLDEDSYRVQKFDSSGNFLYTFGWGVKDGTNEFQVCISGCQRGIAGEGNGQLAIYPAGIIVDPSGNIYVSDTGNNRIQKFSLPIAYTSQVGTLGTAGGELNLPETVEFDSEGNMYVSEGANGNNRVSKFSSSGNFLLTFGWGVKTGANQFEVCTSADNIVSPCRTGLNGAGAGEFNWPLNIAFGSSGNIYVSDLYNNRVQKFSIDQAGMPAFEYTFGWGVKTGADAAEICTYADSLVSQCHAGHFTGNQVGNGPGQITSPQGIAIDSSENIDVVDATNGRIEKFDSSGNYLSQFGTSGTGAGQLYYPSFVRIGQNGNIYVTENSGNRISIFNSSGIFQSAFGWGVQTGASQFEICTTLSGCQSGLFIDFSSVDPPGTVGDGQLDAPYAINIDSNGDLFVADYDSNRIQKFDAGGNFLYTFGWGVKDGTNEFQICTSGCRAGIAGAGNGQFALSPDGIAMDSLNNIFIADLNNNRIQKFSKPAASWSLDSQGTNVLSFLSVSSSHSTSAVICSDCLDSGNNINWTFTGSPPPFPTPPPTPPSIIPGGGGVLSPFIKIILPLLPPLHIPAGAAPATKPTLPSTALNVPVAVCKKGDSFSPVSGLPCTSYTSIDTVCAAGDKFSHVTGLPCTSIQTTSPKNVLHCLITSTLRESIRGDEVRCLQITLGGLVIDGIFGVKTKAALTDFQKNNNLVPDGIFGPRTRAVWERK